MVLKAYTNVTNIIVRLSCPEDPENPYRTCEDDAVLLNSHFDTTLGSPGATDDGSGTAVMMDIIRVLSKRDWSGYKNAIVFCKLYWDTKWAGEGLFKPKHLFFLFFF